MGMNKLWPLPLAGLLLASTLAAQAPAWNSSTSTLKKDEGSIAGMVVKLGGGEPLKKATIHLNSEDDHTHSVSTSTDAGGRFQLKRIEPGRYRLRVMRTGFVTQEYGQKTPNDPGSALMLRPGQELKDLLFRLIPSAVIAGRVIDEEGETVPGAQVSALREVYAHGKRNLRPEANETTNDLGEYRLFSLPPGRYFVRATYERNNPFAGSITAPEGSESPAQGYAPTYYPSSPDVSKALALAVQAGAEVPSVEILLRPVNVFSIRGRVYSVLSKQSATDVVIRLETRNTGLTWNLPGSAARVDRPDGSFEIHDVLPGSYTAIANWFEDGKRYQARQLLEVGNADVDGLSLVIAPGIPVSGRVLWAGQPRLRNGDLRVILRAADSEFAFGASAQVTSDAFTLKDVPEGAYRVVTFGQSEDCFLKSVRFSGTESVEDGFTLRRGVEGTLEVTLSSRGARVQGTVTDADNLPAAGVWVVLVPDEPRRNQARLFKEKTTDQYGHFDLRGIAPGDYKLFGWNEVEQGAWEDPDFLKPFEGKGEKVTLGEGETKSVNLATIKTAATEQQEP
jgi:hypothetical protein